MTANVDLYVYDITNGMAKMMSQMIIGRQIDGIWHTSIVVGNKEYYFQGGVCISTPKTTPFGQPVKSISLGTTELNSIDIIEYVRMLEITYNQNTYDIFDCNCNHFSNSLCEFLTGNKIPIEILGQAAEFKNTPIGQMIKKMQPSVQNNLYSGVIPQESEIIEIQDNIQFTELISLGDKVIIDFYADWCGPCKTVAPEFNKLSVCYKGKVRFAKANIDKNRELAQMLSISTIPTFVSYFDGNIVETKIGANLLEIEEMVKKLNIMSKQ